MNYHTEERWLWPKIKKSVWQIRTSHLAQEAAIDRLRGSELRRECDSASHLSAKAHVGYQGIR